MLERRLSERQQTWCLLAQYFSFYVLFYSASIAIGSDEMIWEECSFVYFSGRLLGIYNVSVEIQAKMGANWPPGTRNRDWSNIFILSVRKVAFCVRVIFICICSHHSNCHFNNVVVNKCTNVTSVTFLPSEVAWTAPLSLLSPTGWSTELKSFLSPANKFTLAESYCFVQTAGGCFLPNCPLPQWAILLHKLFHSTFNLGVDLFWRYRSLKMGNCVQILHNCCEWCAQFNVLKIIVVNWSYAVVQATHSVFKKF